jgi:hypothetical protein
MTNEQKHYRMLRKLKKLRGVRQPFAWFVLTCYEEFISKNPNDAVNLETLIERCNDRWKLLLPIRDLATYQVSIVAVLAFIYY